MKGTDWQREGCVKGPVWQRLRSSAPGLFIVTGPGYAHTRCMTQFSKMHSPHEPGKSLANNKVPCRRLVQSETGMSDSTVIVVPCSARQIHRRGTPYKPCCPAFRQLASYEGNRPQFLLHNLAPAPDAKARVVCLL